MRRLMSDVMEFHRATGVPINDAPVLPPLARRLLRVDLIDEECNRELIPALRANDVPGIAGGKVLKPGGWVPPDIPRALWGDGPRTVADLSRG
jgi:hypothetical protein